MTSGRPTITRSRSPSTNFATEINGVPITIQANQGVGVLVDELPPEFVPVDGGELLGEIRVG